MKKVINSFLIIPILPLLLLLAISLAVKIISNISLTELMIKNDKNESLLTSQMKSRIKSVMEENKVLLRVVAVVIWIFIFQFVLFKNL